MIPVKNIDRIGLKKRILEISYKNKLSHISSCLTAVDIIDEIYWVKEETDPFILSSGHAFLALAVVLEKYYGFNAEQLAKKYGTHPKRSVEDKIYFSTGSLGIGIVAAAGFALADRSQNVYCLISDGECAEPSVFGALDFAKTQHLYNLKIYVNINGYGAYREVDVNHLNKKLEIYNLDIRKHFTKINYPSLQGLQGHYKILSEEEYNDAARI